MVNPWSYEEQLKKYMPKQADQILVRYGWKERMPRGYQYQKVTCPLCLEDFTPRSGRQKYCSLNSRGDRCGKIVKSKKLYRET